MSRAVRFSYFFVLLTLIVIGALKLATPLVTVLFAYFVLSKIQVVARSKWPTVITFLVLFSGIAYGFGFFLKQAVAALPNIAETSIPIIIDFAKRHDVELPFSDPESLKTLLLDSVRTQLRFLGNFARFATMEFVYVVIGVVVAISIFFNSTLDLDKGKHLITNNLYSACCDAIAERFRTFYQSFATVMGAQIMISAINTALTAIFIFWISLPHASLVVAVTFLCGLLPIVGNIISNSVIVGIAVTISPYLGISALVFLVTLHKLEYFLNSKIIGDRIKNPMWLTLIGLILGERLMGIPGMILAPVVLNYIKVEASRISMEGKKRAAVEAAAVEA